VIDTNGSAYLLDIHVLLWWWFAPDRLTPQVRSLLIDSTTTVFVSAASIWELSLKHHQGKLPELTAVVTDLPRLLQTDGFQPLPISIAHGLRAGGYSQPHRDPFDCMLAAQAELEGLVLITADAQLSAFPYQILG
jgi:PIN domain nuclease of toxin-antitoxin system